MNRLRTGIAAGFLILCLMLGGASAAGAFANGILQVASVLILVLHAWSRGAPPLAAAGRWPVFLFLGFAIVAGAHLIPLPPSVWTALPGREIVVRSVALLGLRAGTMPASLDPGATFASMLWLLPPAAMFLVATRLTRDERSNVAKVLLVMAVANITLGALQLFGGNDSPLRFYAVTNANRAVGFFSNANHVATLLLSSLPFAVLFVARAIKSRKEGAREGRAFIYAAVGLFIAIGIAINGSLAGYALLIPVVVASLVLFAKATKARPGVKTLGLGVVAVAFFVGASLLGPLSKDRFAAKLDVGSTTGRNISIPTTLAAARDFFPVGSGLGTFRDVYRTYEPKKDVSFIYVNHAHNDHAEVALELGLPGLLFIWGFVVWWLTRSFAVWRGDFNGAGLARAGSIVVGIVIAHSIVDYPIRTSAIAAVVALAAGFMIPPPAARTRRASGSGQERRDGRRSQARNIDADAI